MTLSFRLPWPPSGNNMYTVARGRKILSSEGRSYRDEAICSIGNLRPVPGKVSVRMRACPPDRRRRDLDNLLKMPLDCCVKAGLIDDDSKIQSIQIEWGEVRRDPHLLIHIEQCSTGT